MKISISLVLCIGTFVSGILVPSSGALAQLKPEDEIKFRQSGMMFMRWNMGKIKNQVIKNPQTYNREQVITAANAIAAVADSNIEALFSPETVSGSGWKETRIKPEFFRQPAEVERLIQALKQETNELANVANSGDVQTIKEQFDKTFQACRSCHKKFRNE